MQERSAVFFIGPNLYREGAKTIKSGMCRMAHTAFLFFDAAGLSHCVKDLLILPTRVWEGFGVRFFGVLFSPGTARW